MYAQKIILGVSLEEADADILKNYEPLLKLADLRHRSGLTLLIAPVAELAYAVDLESTVWRDLRVRIPSGAFSIIAC